MKNHVIVEDFETESRIQEYKLEDGSNFINAERLPAQIIVKIKISKNDNQTNKRALSGISKKRS